MRCDKCGSKTTVFNSRARSEVNIIWRRRKCLSCSYLFTTEEVVTEGARSIISEVDELTENIKKCTEDFKSIMEIRYCNNEE